MGGEVRPDVRNITSILIETGTVTEAQVQAGLARQRDTGIRIGEVLVEMGAATEQDIGWALARQLGIPFLDLTPETLDRDLLATFPEGVLLRLMAVPLVRVEHTLSVAFGDPTDREAVAELEHLAGLPIRVSAAAPSTIREVLDTLDGPAARSRPTTTAPPTSSDLYRDRSGTRALTTQLHRALEAGASELHFIPEHDGLAVYHRVADRLVRLESEPASLQYFVLARIEALGGPVIAGDEVHAFGRVLCPLGDRDIRLDVSLLGCEHGVAITLGLRPAHAAPRAIESLGLDPVDLARLRAVFDVPAGLIVIAGPPRSGCSATLSSLLAIAGSGDRISIAFECGAGTDMPASIRLGHDRERSRASWESIAIGHDPDVIALDNVLTGDSIDRVLSSAACGHMLLVTTDWTDSFALIDYLMSRPGGRSILADRLRLVMQQRRPRLDGSASGGGLRASGPPVLFEPLFVNGAMREEIRCGAGVTELRALADADGFRSLYEQVRGLLADHLLREAEAARVLS